MRRVNVHFADKNANVNCCRDDFASNGSGVFTRTKAWREPSGEQLNKDGIRSAAIRP